MRAIPSWELTAMAGGRMVCFALNLEAEYLSLEDRHEEAVRVRSSDLEETTVSLGYTGSFLLSLLCFVFSSTICQFASWSALYSKSVSSILPLNS
jgi:hypothetical protein